MLSLSTGAGSDAGSLLTSAKKDGDDYVINGSKVDVILLPFHVNNAILFHLRVSICVIAERPVSFWYICDLV